MSIGIIKYSDGGIVYGCNTTAYPPTNPKSGSSYGNTVIWSERTHESRVIPNTTDQFSWTSTKQQTSTIYTTYSKPTVATAAKRTNQPLRQSDGVSRYSIETAANPCKPFIDAECTKVRPIPRQSSTVCRTYVPATIKKPPFA